jgi:putative NADPH-quinone reductase
MDHYKALKRVLKYLRYTLDYKLYYISYPTILKGYNDANWISDTRYSKSINGYVW